MTFCFVTHLKRETQTVLQASKKTLENSFHGKITESEISQRLVFQRFVQFNHV